VSSDDRVALGLELLAHLEHAELTVKEAMDRIETVTTDPAVQREILTTAQEEGIVEREDGTVRPTSAGTFVSLESDVVVKEGEFDCRRCGAGISEGHFVQFDSDELGPFGSTCIRKVLGRD
jgi:predicted methyltransferase